MWYYHCLTNGFDLALNRTCQINSLCFLFSIRTGVCWAVLSSPPLAPVRRSIRAAESCRSLPPVHRATVRAPRATGATVSRVSRIRPGSDPICVRWANFQTASDHGITRYTMRWETVIYAYHNFFCIIICKKVNCLMRNAVIKPVAVVGLCGEFIWTRLENMAH